MDAKSTRSLQERFGAAVRKRRMDHGMAQVHVADCADMDASWLGEIERGKHHASLATYERLFGILGISVRLTTTKGTVDPQKFPEWTKAENARLTQLYLDEGITVEMIARRFGRSKYAIVQQAARLGLRRPRLAARARWIHDYD